MSAPKLSYDPECETLARHFLAEEETLADIDTFAPELAQQIQDAVELFFLARASALLKAGGAG